jgi:putative DNA primase/helicase
MIGLSLKSIAAALDGEIWNGRQVLCPGPGHSKKDRSLSVILDRSEIDGFVVHSFAGDDWRQCRDYVRSKLGVEPPRRASWQEIWNEAQHPRASLVERYLASRKLVLPPEAAGGAVRFHPQCPFGLATTPAMVALVRDVRSDEPIGIHRTALDELGRKRAIDGKTRMALGKIAGGAIKLTPDEDVEASLGVGEGVETALSIRCVGDFSALPVWACLSAGGLGAFPLLSGVEGLFVAIDNDEAGRDAARKAIARWHEADRRAFAIEPKAATPHADLNDCLRGTEERANHG